MKKFLSVLLIGIMLLSGCAKNETMPTGPNEAFQTYLDTLYEEVFSTDDLGINLYFNEPERFGINPEPYTLGFFTEEDYINDLAHTQRLIAELGAFENLSPQQEIERTSLIADLRLLLGSEEFYELEIGEMLSSSRSFIMTIPSLLDMYSFNIERDIDYYFNYIETLESSIVRYVELEKQRQVNGTGMSAPEIEDIIQFAESIASAATQHDYFLNRTFETKISQLDFGDEAQKQVWIERHRDAMATQFMAAYQTLADLLGDIDAGEMTGLANKPNGKAYYQYLIRRNTASNISVDDLSRLVNQREKEIAQRIRPLIEDYDIEQLHTDITNGHFFEGIFEDAMQLYDFILEKMEPDFPAITVPLFEVRTVDESLRDSASPAFYFIPRVDAKEDEMQAIYVNGTYRYEDFATYLHEGLPGHLYHFNYFNQSNHHPIRTILSSSGITEGWATYTELYGARYVLEDELARIYADYMELVNLSHVMIDMGINYWGWTLEETLSYFINQGRIDKDSTVDDIRDIYKMFVENPAVYPTYFATSVYLRMLSEKAQENWADYSDYEFHNRVLELGPMTFNLLARNLDLKIFTE